MRLDYFLTLGITPEVWLTVETTAMAARFLVAVVLKACVGFYLIYLGYATRRLHLRKHLPMHPALMLALGTYLVADVIMWLYEPLAQTQFSSLMGVTIIFACVVWSLAILVLLLRMKIRRSRKCSQ